MTTEEYCQELMANMRNCAEVMEETALQMLFLGDAHKAFEQNGSILLHLAQSLERFAGSFEMYIAANTDGTMTVH